LYRKKAEKKKADVANEKKEKSKTQKRKLMLGGAG